MVITHIISIYTHSEKYNRKSVFMIIPLLDRLSSLDQQWVLHVESMCSQLEYIHHFLHRKIILFTTIVIRIQTQITIIIVVVVVVVIHERWTIEQCRFGTTTHIIGRVTIHHVAQIISTATTVDDTGTTTITVIVVIVISVVVEW